MERPNGLAFSCRERRHKLFKKAPISCAKRSTATPCWASTIVCRPPCICLNHTTFHLPLCLNNGCVTRRAQRRRVPAVVFVPASLRLPSVANVGLHRRRSGPRGASHSHFLMHICICRAAWCATSIAWPQRLVLRDVRVVGAARIVEAKCADLQVRVKRNSDHTSEMSSGRMIATCRNWWVDGRD